MVGFFRIQSLYTRLPMRWVFFCLLNPTLNLSVGFFNASTFGIGLISQHIMGA